jgi:hypothetical protein
MKAEELRIGNWLKRDSQPEGFQIDIDSLVRISNGAKDYEAIPLTKDWLLKFGLKIDVSGVVISGATYWRKKAITFYESDGKYYLKIGEKLNSDLGTQVIEFDKVHELQNIYALTGEELTITE